MSDRLGNTLAAIIVGAAVGAGLGVLFAPDKGSKTRKKIKSSFDESKDDLEDKIDEIKKQVKSIVGKNKSELEDNLDQFLSNTSHKRDEVIAKLESKLAELKKQGTQAIDKATK